MEIKKMVDLDSLTEEEKIVLDSGEKTEEDLLIEHETKEKEEAEKREEELKKLKEIAENQKIRAEKAEAEAKKSKEGKDNEPSKKELSQPDLLAFIGAKITNEDDIREITDFASLRKITVKEALDTKFIKSLLAEKEEERKTAEATSTKQRRAGQTAVSSSELLEKAQKTGELPEKEEDIAKVVKARFDKKAANK